MKPRFTRNGEENGKPAYLVQKKALGSWLTIASIVHDGQDWCLHHPSGRIDRSERLSEAKDEALKLA